MGETVVTVITTSAAASCSGAVARASAVRVFTALMTLLHVYIEMGTVLCDLM